MTWSYDGNDLGKDLNWIRLRIGDTDAGNPFLTNEEIEQILALEPRREVAAAMAAESIAAIFARWGAMKEQQQYLQLADRLKTEAGAGYL